MGGISEIQKGSSCPVQDTCPLQVICSGCSGSNYEETTYSTSNSATKPLKELLPRSISEVEKGNLLWTNLHFEQCVHIIQSGVFISFGYNEQGQEVPFALFGAGVMVGIAELYLPTVISDTYHVRSLLPGTVCTVPLKAIRQRLLHVSGNYEQRLLISALTNQASSAFTQAKIVSRNTIYERVFALLLYLQDLIARGETGRTTLKLTHEEVATLVHSDRVSVTRALHRMRDDGLIELGYKSITLCKDALDDCSEVHIMPTQYLIVDQENELTKPLGRDARVQVDGVVPPYIWA